MDSPIYTQGRLHRRVRRAKLFQKQSRPLKRLVEPMDRCRIPLICRSRRHQGFIPLPEFKGTGAYSDQAVQIALTHQALEDLKRRSEVLEKEVTGSNRSVREGNFGSIVWTCKKALIAS